MIDLSFKGENMKILIKKLHPDAVVPRYANYGDSGFDLVALEDVELKPGETKLIRTGLAIDVGSGYELQVRPRSGLSLKTPLRVANSPGTVDSSYRGEVCVIMTNTDDQVNKEDRMKWSLPQKISKGNRIAQGVVCPVMRADIEVVEYLGETNRGAGGFGSTGK